VVGTIGRVWRFDYTHVTSGPRARYLWHWYWRSFEGRDDAEGDAPTLEIAMADFRRAWTDQRKAQWPRAKKTPRRWPGGIKLASGRVFRSDNKLDWPVPDAPAQSATLPPITASAVGFVGKSGEARQ
jgi:hypothetical protein